jgi:hypothetical protein
LAYVAASLAPRTVETAIAMGFAVDDCLDLGGDLWEAAQSELAHREIRDDLALYLRYQELMNAGGAVARLGRPQSELWETIITKVPEGSRALLISHGGLIEPGLIAALPTFPHARWGRGFRHGEGVRIFYDGTRFVDAEVLHLEPSPADSQFR